MDDCGEGGEVKGLGISIKGEGYDEGEGLVDIEDQG